MNAREAFPGTGIRQAFSEPPEAGDLEADIAEDMEREFSPNRKERHMAMTTRDYANQTAAAGTPARPTIADTLESAVAALSNAASELTAITDRLCGSKPENPAGASGKLRGVADGAFAQIDQSRDDIEAITEIILNSTSRIRGRL